MNFLSRFHVIFLFILFCQPVAAQKRIACIGDSVTKGYGLKDSTKSYPYQLQQLLGENFVIGNFGHSGATLLQKGHNPYINTQVYKDALAFKPDMIIIALGLNDTDPRNWPNYSNEFFADYTALINDFKQVNPNVEVFICKMTPIFSGHSRFLSGTRDWYNEIQALIPDIASVNNAKLIDNQVVLSKRIDLFEDNLHPSAEGAYIIANNVYQHVAPILRKLRVSETIGSHMVLQRNMSNSIQGEASSNEIVKVGFHNKIYTTQANQLGKWEVALPAMKAGGPFTMEISTSTDALVLEDIYFGDVYLASGQSNMAFQLQAMKNAHSYLQNVSNSSRIRFFKNKNIVETNHTSWDTTTLQAVNELQFFSGQWEVPNAENIKHLSAIAYVFANELYSALDVPIGIIDLSVGGSTTESWISRETLENDDLLATYIHNWRTSDFVQDFCKNRSAKNLEKTLAKYQRHPYDPSYNFEAGIQKWLGTNIRAILWYQGESNAHNIEHHSHLFKKMVSSWRSSFKQELPFYIVQLSSINRPSWGAFRDSQRVLSKELPHVFMAVSSDVGHPTDVHPIEKEIVGKRLAALAKENEYKMSIQASSPSPIDVKKSDGFIIVEFNNCKALKLPNGENIKDLKVMNDYGQLIPVEEIKIIKNKVRFKEPETGVRYLQYGYTAFTDANLYSDSDVPVSTFNLKIK